MVEFTGPFGMRRSGRSDDVLNVVTVYEPGTKEHASHVYINSDVAATQLPERDMKLAFKEFDGHRRLLLADAIEAFEAVA